MAWVPRLAISWASRPAIADGGDVACRDAGDELLHVEPFAGPLPVDFGHPEIRVVAEILGNPLGAAAFGSQIQLLAQRSGKLAHQFPRAEACQPGDAALGQLCQTIEQAQIGFNLRADAGAADFQDDFVAILQPRAVYLANRGGGQRRRVEPGKQAFRTGAQIGLELRAQARKVDGVDLILQALEFADPFRVEQVDPGGENLPELDEGRPEFLDGQANPLRGAQPGVGRRLLPVQRFAGLVQQAGDAGALQQIGKAVADHDLGNRAQAADVFQQAHPVEQGRCLVVHEKLPSGRDDA